jgi:hypothetical protein
MNRTAQKPEFKWRKIASTTRYLRRGAKGLSADFEAAKEELVDLLALIGAPHERFAAKGEGKICDETA